MENHTADAIRAREQRARERLYPDEQSWRNAKAMAAKPAIDEDRLSQAITAWNIAFPQTPQNVDLVNRARMALDALPDEVVQELGEAADALARLAGERLGSEEW